MPIKRLGTHIMSYGSSARLGFIKKGAPKGKNRPGEDLDHYRFDPKLFPDELSKIFRDAYGDTPRTIRVRMAYDTALETFPNWVEARKGKTLLWRGDGETVTTWLEDGKYHNGARPQSDFDQKNAAERGHLIVYIPELVKAHYDGVVWALTSSAHDISTLWDRLRHYERMSRGNLTGIEFSLTRVLKPVTDHKTGRTKDMWLMELTSDAEWMALVQAQRKRDTYALASGGGLMGLPSGPQTIDQDTGEIVPQYALPEPSEVETIQPSTPQPLPPKDSEIKEVSPRNDLIDPASDKDKKAFHAMGTELYGSKWDEVRKSFVTSAKRNRLDPTGTGNRSKSSKTLTQAQVEFACGVLKGRLQNAQKDVYSLAEHISKFTDFDKDTASGWIVAIDDSESPNVGKIVKLLSGVKEINDSTLAKLVEQNKSIDGEIVQDPIPF